MATRRVPPLETIDDVLVDEVATRVRRERALRVTQLTSQKLTKRAQAALFEALERRGFERTKSWVRVPLRAQLEALLQTRAELDLKAKGLVAGAESAPVVKRAAAGLCDAGLAALFVVGKREVLARPSADALASDEVAKLNTLATEIAQRLTAVRPKANAPKRVLSRKDIAALWSTLGPVTPAKSATVQEPTAAAQADAPVSPPQEATAQEPDVAARVTTALRSLELSGSGGVRSVFVPELARRVAPMPLEQLHAALLEGASAGRIELRPESGVGSLRPEDAALCLALPTGQLVSYVRRLDGGSVSPGSSAQPATAQKLTKATG